MEYRGRKDNGLAAQIMPCGERTRRIRRTMGQFMLLAALCVCAFSLALFMPTGARAGSETTAEGSPAANSTPGIPGTPDTPDTPGAPGTSGPAPANATEQLPAATITPVPTRTPTHWEAPTLHELADTLGWPSSVSQGNGGKLSVGQIISTNEWAQASIRPFAYRAGAEAAFAAEQEDAQLAGLHVAATSFYSYPAYVATLLNDKGAVVERRLHWLTDTWIIAVEVHGTSQAIAALEPQAIARQLLYIAVQHGLPAPPGGVLPSPSPTGSVPPTATPTAVSCGVAFDDVTTGYWAYNYIMQLACQGVLAGYEDGTFRPDNATTRAQLAKIIVLSERWTLVDPAAPTFSDVDPSHLFYRYIETAYAHGIVSGYDDGSFRPDNYVKRAQVAKMLVLARGWPLTVQSAVPLCDVPSGYWAWTYIQVAIQRQVFTGYINGCFYPDAYATRAQLAKVIVQAHR